MNNSNKKRHLIIGTNNIKNQLSKLHMQLNHIKYSSPTYKQKPTRFQQKREKMTDFIALLIIYTSIMANLQ